MIRAVLDTNVIVSAILAPKGAPATILRMGLEGAYMLLLSPHILDEARRVVRYPKIIKLLKRHGISLQEVDDLVDKIAKTSLVTAGALVLRVIEEDPKDDMILACAVEEEADFVVSGDSHLTNLKSFQGIPILQPVEFLRIIAENTKAEHT
jgi:putative PIN family toxin of toxin-antitoxin system